MEYKIDFGVWGSIFAVPCSVVDEHIRLAGAVQLKVLLYCLRHSQKNINDEMLSKALGISKADVADAMQYWTQVGLFDVSDNNVITGIKSANAEDFDSADSEPAIHSDALENSGSYSDTKELYTKEKEQPKPARQRVTAITSKPTSQEVNQRAEESEEIAFLLQEAQLRLSRMITHSESATLVYLHDFVGLPSSVILMVMQYASAHNKCNMRYIEKVALQWAEEEIYTFDLAEKKLKDLEIFEDNWSSLLNTMGLDKRSPSPTERKYLTKWLSEWGFSMEIVKLAYYECADNTHKVIFKYIDKILEGWHNAGVKKPEDVKLLKATAEGNKSKPKAKTNAKNSNKLSREASFDLDEYELMTDINPTV